MAYRNSSSSTSNNGSTSAGASQSQQQITGFTLPANTGSRTGAGGTIGQGSSSNSSTSNTSSLLSAFNNPNSAVRGALGGLGGGAVGAGGSAASSASAAAGGSGLGGNSGQAQAAFMNAGPNRTVSNVGQQAAAQGGLPAAANAGGGAGAGQYGSATPSPGNPTATDLNLDPSDFPALGGGNGIASSLGQLSGASLLSSYATQASAANAAAAAGQGSFFSSTPGNNPSLLPQQQREFSADDFPALGGDHHGQNGLLTNGQAAQAAAAQARSNQDQQASAAAALAHRQNLLGTMSAGQQNQARSVSNAAASTVFQDDLSGNNGLKRPTSKLPGQGSTLSPYPANSPLPPPSSKPQTAQASPHQANSLLNGITQTLDSTSPSLAVRQALQQDPSAHATGLPPQLSNMLLQQHLASQSQQHRQATVLQQQQQAQLPQTPAQQVLYSPADQFGLLGLLNIIKMSADPDFGMLTLGTDLEKLGLDLGSASNLHSSFITPWADSDLSNSNIEPEYVLPPCYNVQPPPASGKVGNFTDETLFFIFYSQPRDAMQEAAAEQLYKRNWRYHKDLHLWLTKDVGSEPTQKTATYERGSYIFFDPNAWEKVQKEFVLVFEHLETRHRGTGAAIAQPAPTQHQQYSGIAQ